MTGVLLISDGSRQLRARRALSLFKDVQLRTRRALLLYKVHSDSALLALNWWSLHSISRTNCKLDLMFPIATFQLHITHYNPPILFLLFDRIQISPPTTAVMISLACWAEVEGHWLPTRHLFRSSQVIMAA